jgi:hypothetical protein
VDELWVGVFADSESEPTLRRVEEALRLIKTYDRIRYDRLMSDLDRVWVQDVPGALGNFEQSLRACVLDRRYVLAETSAPEVIAATIVHEATHARLHRRGIDYEEELRPRIERACLRRELAFAARLPDGEQVRTRAESALALCTTQDFWTNAAFAARHDPNHIEVIRHLGAPEWLVRAALVLLALRRGVSGFAQRLRRLIQSR